MPDWQEKVILVMLAETSDLRELAELAGYDPATFWRDANFRKADLSGQDLTGIDVSQARLPPGVTLPTLPTDTSDAPKADRLKEPAEWAAAMLASGNRWLEKAMDNWAEAETYLDHATVKMKDAVDAYVDAGTGIPMALARKRLAEALLLLSDAAPHRAKDAINTAEYELRVASSALEGTKPERHWQSVQDARGYLLRRRARRQKPTVAQETLRKAADFHRDAQNGPNFVLPTCAKIHALATERERAALSTSSSRLAAELVEQKFRNAKSELDALSDYARPEITCAKNIEVCAMNILYADDVQRRSTVPDVGAIAEILEDASRVARETDLPLEWAEAQRYLAMLANLAPSHAYQDDSVANDANDTSDAVEEALSVVEHAFQKGQALLHRALMERSRADDHIEDALFQYSEVERLYKVIEDKVTQLTGPSSDRALLWQGVAHLLKAGLLADGEVGESLDEARFALDVAVAGLSGRLGAVSELAAAQDAQAFALRFEAARSQENEARFLLAEAAALHRRASRTEQLLRAVSYRYRLHSRGAERERAVIKGNTGKLADIRHRAAESLRAVQSRNADRSSPDERSALVAVLAEYGLSTRDAARVSPGSVSRQEIEAAGEAIREAHHMAETLFLPLDWLWTLGAEADLRKLLQE